MLTETKNIDKIEVLANGFIQIREAARILRDGEEIAKSYHRTSLTPGQDLTGQPDNVVAVAQAAWTPEVIAEFQAKLAAQRQADEAAAQDKNAPRMGA